MQLQSRRRGFLREAHPAGPRSACVPCTTGSDRPTARSAVAAQAPFESSSAPTHPEHRWKAVERSLANLRAATP